MISKIKHKLRLGNKTQIYTKMKADDHIDSILISFKGSFNIMSEVGNCLCFICSLQDYMMMLDF